MEKQRGNGGREGGNLEEPRKFQQELKSLSTAGVGHAIFRQWIGKAEAKTSINPLLEKKQRDVTNRSEEEERKPGVKSRK